MNLKACDLYIEIFSHGPVDVVADFMNLSCLEDNFDGNGCKAPSLLAIKEAHRLAVQVNNVYHDLPFDVSPNLAGGIRLYYTHSLDQSSNVFIIVDQDGVARISTTTLHMYELDEDRLAAAFSLRQQ